MADRTGIWTGWPRSIPRGVGVINLLTTYEQPSIVERAFNRTERRRAGGTRYDKLAITYRAGIVLTLTVERLKPTHPNLTEHHKTPSATAKTVEAPEPRDWSQSLRLRRSGRDRDVPPMAAASHLHRGYTFGVGFPRF
ncbi:hypothetical protein ABZW96_35350 [Nocardia sp. NPDC004168]|uniref:hypothetical protein n=1 Tax=Nocardia sp. NPDC004168 TaxID=3154452 RepID=UPI0033A6FB1E